MTYSLNFSQDFYEELNRQLILKRKNDPDDWRTLSEELFNCKDIPPDDVMEQIIQVSTCTSLHPPVEVWIDSEGFYTVEVPEN